MSRTDVTAAAPREVVALRRDTLGWVSQVLGVVPRVPTLDVVAEPLRALGIPAPEARARAAAHLGRLNLPSALWPLSPTTFSGGEQQWVNIARGFVHPYPAPLLDLPMASLDPVNRAVVSDLIREAKRRGDPRHPPRRGGPPGHLRPRGGRRGLLPPHERGPAHRRGRRLGRGQGHADRRPVARPPEPPPRPPHRDARGGRGRRAHRRRDAGRLRGPARRGRLSP